MNYSNDVKALWNDLCSGWKPFELFWLAAFLTAQGWAYWQQPDSWLAMISGISGIICVVLVSKGKMVNYLFGLIFAYIYFYVAWKANFLGEMNTVLYVYLLSQFIGYFVWKEHLQKDGTGEAVRAKKLSAKGWIVLVVSLVVSTLLFVQALNAAGGSSTGLDGMTTMITVAAQLLMILRYREQWILWIGLVDSKFAAEQSNQLTHLLACKTKESHQQKPFIGNDYANHAGRGKELLTKFEQYLNTKCSG
ncbi:nicotinamide riboside transporter PnuC [Kingella kingae]|uniref:nicotinamide riboside transporter PnuC n=1 Tax=Kingella kingae TaxID=504 RepID=UPI0002585092|nr:nicotinamide riboside transporter PnuC [Kingella kingae]EIC13577.1 UDP-N-acetylglucosamine 1-carboxyvinyltransferase [Kingella kingae PYKK081]MBD3614201.1 nicotinamide riboside transporter PnuC [Kingella kingae]MBD3632476.1 nicotinamide riboside transporter PnuC [Kingella kingae]MBD3659869.1 nicotinamide riboside transporter PnuC [Kingella kingae]MDK4569078.1 nicotinamide riboside transporter PnuC [Kingella kingae]